MLDSIDSKSKLIEVKEIDNKVLLIFSTKRYFAERTTINTNNLDSSVKNSLGDYDGIIGVKNILDIFLT